MHMGREKINRKSIKRKWGRKMNILILEWDSFAHEYVMEEFMKAGCGVDKCSWPYGIENMRDNEKLFQKLSKILKEKEYAFVFSFDFFPVAAKACNQCGIKYAAWIYDSPYMLLYSKYTMLDTNYIFFFDKSLFYEFRQHGVKHAYYLPMAAPVDYYDRLKASGDGEKYRADLSFVGSTYHEEGQDFFRHFAGVDDYTAGYLTAIMNMQEELYGNFILEELLNDNILMELRRVCPIQKEEDEWESDGWIYANYFLARKLTGNQRIGQLELLGEKHTVKLYAPKQNRELKNIVNYGPVDYMTEMPLIFQNSKINLNMTLRSIHTGIPLRAMDIMGCGGFLLTNYQQDFLDYFEPGVDFVYYSSRKELADLTDYYLQHDEERMEIAGNGYRKLKSEHTYKNRVETLLAYVKEP